MSLFYLSFVLKNVENFAFYIVILSKRFFSFDIMLFVCDKGMGCGRLSRPSSTVTAGMFCDISHQSENPPKLPLVFIFGKPVIFEIWEAKILSLPLFSFFKKSPK